MSPALGSPVDRVDGAAKVTGMASFTADHRVPALLYAALVTSTMTRGRITAIDTTAARAAPGVVDVVTAANAPSIAAPGSPPWPFGQSVLPLQDDVVRYAGQIVAVVVADTVERARYAASLVRPEYTEDSPRTSLAEGVDSAFIPASADGIEYVYRRGDSEAALRSAPVTMDASFSTVMQHHNPMEPSSTTAVWDGDRLTLFDATQSVTWTRQQVASMLGIDAVQVRVLAPYLGGGFGCKGYVWPHTVLTAAIARQLGRPLKLVLTRADMYSLHGHRSPTLQRLRVGADHDGRLLSISHEMVAQTSTFDDVCWEEVGTSYLYACADVAVQRRVVRLDFGNPTPMRAPSGVGGFALETMLDELSYAVDVDPVELRRRNYSSDDPVTGTPWGTAKFLDECYLRGAELFGWPARRRPPGSTTRDGLLTGIGMATAFHPVYASEAEASVEMRSDGSVVVRSATQDIGTGVRTVVTQVAADALGIGTGSVHFDLGDTSFPPGPPSAGSRTAVSVGTAVQDACRRLRSAVIDTAIADPRSPLYGVSAVDVAVTDGRLVSRHDPRRADTYAQVVARRGAPITARGATTGQSASHSYGAVFAEVGVSPATGEVRVTRLTGVFDCGRILNPKTAASQATGGMIWGLGTALTEHTVVDAASGRLLNTNLSGYLIPVSADVPDIVVEFVDKPDPGAGPLGARGNGELSPNGTTAAIGNAVYHATGRRVRDLPITPDRALGD